MPRRHGERFIPARAVAEQTEPKAALTAALDETSSVSRSSRALAMREKRSQARDEGRLRHHGAMAIEDLLPPKRLWTRAEVVDSRPSPVPKTAGAYAWYFRGVPGRVSVEDCHHFDGMPMLYVGIAPKRPHKDGRESSRTSTSACATTTPAR
jgi:hypothetical protein